MLYYVQRGGLAHYVNGEEEAKRLAAEGYTVTKMQEMRLDENGDLVEEPEDDGSATGTSESVVAEEPVLAGKEGKA